MLYFICGDSVASKTIVQIVKWFGQRAHVQTLTKYSTNYEIYNQFKLTCERVPMNSP